MQATSKVTSLSKGQSPFQKYSHKQSNLLKSGERETRRRKRGLQAWGKKIYKTTDIPAYRGRGRKYQEATQLCKTFQNCLQHKNPKSQTVSNSSTPSLASCHNKPETTKPTASTCISLCPKPASNIINCIKTGQASKSCKPVNASSPQAKPQSFKPITYFSTQNVTSSKPVIA